MKLSDHSISYKHDDWNDESEAATATATKSDDNTGDFSFLSASIVINMLWLQEMWPVEAPTIWTSIACFAGGFFSED